jgi:hypothetical protein
MVAHVKASLSLQIFTFLKLVTSVCNAEGWCAAKDNRASVFVTLTSVQFHRDNPPCPRVYLKGCNLSTDSTSHEVSEKQHQFK